MSFNRKKYSNELSPRPTIIVKDVEAFPDKPINVNSNTYGEESKELPPT